MRRELFVSIVDALEEHDEYFTWKRNAAGKLGFSPIQKATMAIRQLAYGVTSDLFDEYLRMAASTGIECLKKFCQCVIEIYGETYLRAPNEADVERLMAFNAKRGFPGMLGSLDCMHWTWKNYPRAWHGMFCGKSKKPTTILEAVASHDLWIWHAFFGLPGSLNDINVLHRSPLMHNIVLGKMPRANYTVNGHTYEMGYYLADGLYPKWSTLVQTISVPDNEMEQVTRATFVLPNLIHGILSCSISRKPKNQHEKTLNVHSVCCKLDLQ